MQTVNLLPESPEETLAAWSFGSLHFILGRDFYQDSIEKEGAAPSLPSIISGFGVWLISILPSSLFTESGEGSDPVLHLRWVRGGRDCGIPGSRGDWSQ